jgi:hypothetical protein
MGLILIGFGLPVSQICHADTWVDLVCEAASIYNLQVPGGKFFHSCTMRLALELLSGAML